MRKSHIIVLLTSKMHKTMKRIQTPLFYWTETYNYLSTLYEKAHQDGGFDNAFKGSIQ